MSKLSRREFLRLSMGTAAGAALAACQPQVIERTVVVKETVEVEKEVRVKETVEVEKEKIVEKEKVVKETIVVQPEVAILRFWHHWSADRHPPLQQTVKEFEEAYPGIKVVENLLPQAAVTEKILTAIAAGDAPNVAMLIRRKLQTFAAEEALVPLDEYLTRDGIDGSQVYYASEWALCLWQGKVYTLPLTEGNRFLFYNTELFEKAGLDPTEPPTTWNELEEYTKKLTTFKDDAIDTIGFNANMLLSYLVVLNGEGQSVSEDRKTVTLNTPEAVEALEWAVDFTDNINQGYQAVQAFSAQTAAWETDPFVVGKQAILNSASYMFFFLYDYNPDLQYGICRFPHGPAGSKPFAVNYPSWGYVIPTGVEDQDESWELLKYMCYGDGCKNFMQRILRSTSVIEYNEDPFYEDNVPHWNEFRELIQDAVHIRLSPVFEKFLDVQEGEKEKALLHKVTAAEAMEAAQEQGQKMLDEFWETH